MDPCLERLRSNESRLPRGTKKLVWPSWGTWMSSSSKRRRRRSNEKPDEFYFLQEQENNQLEGEGRFQDNDFVWVSASRGINSERSSIVLYVVSWWTDDVPISSSLIGLEVRVAPRQGPKDLKCDTEMVLLLAEELLDPIDKDLSLLRLIIETEIKY